MHKYIHKIVFLSAAGDFYILVSIFHCKNDDFSIKFINPMVKSQTNWLFLKKLAFGELHICEKNCLRPNTYFLGLHSYIKWKICLR